MTNSGNFNNPSELNLSNSYSVVSPFLDNPFVTQTIEYGDFRSADPTLTEILPKTLNLGPNNNGNADNYKDVLCGSKGSQHINLGLTSPGAVVKSMSCSGLDYIQTNPDYSTLPFQTCLNKFEKQYFMPNMVFNNLLNNLPYTFNQLSEDDKKHYLKSLQNFVNNEKNENGNKNNKSTKQEINTENFINSENFQVKEHLKGSCSDDGFSLTGILTIVIVIILIIIFLIFITKNN